MNTKPEELIDTIFYPEPIKLKPEDEERLLNKISQLYFNTITSSYYKSKIDKWTKCRELYEAKNEPTDFPFPGAFNLDLGVIPMVVDNLKARFKLSTIGAKPMFNAIPVTPRGEENKSWVEDNMNYILDNDIDIETKLDTIIHKTLLYGTCITKVFWEKYLKETRRYDTLTGYPKLSEDIKEKGELTVIDLPDFIVPEGASSDLNKIPWIFQRIWYSLDDLRKKVYIGFYPQEAVEKLEGMLRLQKEEIAKSPEEKLELIRKLEEEKIAILECYMRFDADNDGLEEECIFWVCPSPLVYLRGYYLRDIFFDGERPFNRFVYIDTGTFYGKGIPEILEAYRDAINSVFNFSLNSALLQILPWGFFRIGSSFKPKEITLAPGVFIPVDDINDVRIAQFPPTATLGEGIVMLLMSFVERLTGISSPHMGKEFPTRKTATEVKTIISEGNLKHEDRIASFQEEFSKLLKKIFNLYRQNQPAGRFFSIYDEISQEVRYVKGFSALDNLEDYDFVILGTLTTGNKVIEREDTLGLYALLSKHPILAEYPKGQQELLKELLNTFGKKNIKRFLPPDAIINALTQLKIQEYLTLIQKKMAELQAGIVRPPEGEMSPSRTKMPEKTPEAGLPPEPEMPGAEEEIE